MEKLTTNEGKMSSLEISEITGKPHNDILKSIRKMEAAWVKVTGGNFSLSEYTDGTGRKLPCYQLTQEECLYVATKFNDEARAKLVLRWKKLETTNREHTKPLSTAEFLLQNAQLLVEHEKRLNNVETKVDSIIQRQIEAENELKALPLSTESAQEMSLRDKIRLLVNRYCEYTGIFQKEVWDNVYQKLYYTYHISIKSHKKQANESWLDIAERKNYLDKIYTIVSDLLRSKDISEHQAV